MDRNKILFLSDKITEWALYILVFSIPFSKSMIEACITTAFFSWIIKKIILKDFSLKRTTLNTALLALFVISAISIINADFKLLAARALVSKCLEYIVLYFIVIETVDTETKLKNLLKMAFISAFIVMVDAYIQYYVLHEDLFRGYVPFKYNPPYATMPSMGFPSGPFHIPNDLSAWMLIILACVLSLFTWGGKKLGEKFILGSFLLSFLYLLYLTNVKSAWAGFLVSIFLMFFIYNKKAFIVLIAVFLLIAAIAFILLPQEKKHELSSAADQSMNDRFYMWHIGWKIFFEHPIIGNGLNMFHSKFKEFREDKHKGILGSYAHNGFLQIAADTGIIGLLVFLTLIGKAFHGAFRYINREGPHRALALGLVGGLSAFLIHSFFDTNLQSLPLITLFWLGVAILMSLENICPRNPKTSL